MIIEIDDTCKSQQVSNLTKTALHLWQWQSVQKFYILDYKH